MKAKIQQLKNDIVEFAAQGRACRAEIRTTRGLDRYYAWVGKRSVGHSARLALLAYAYLRGRPRWTQEARPLDLDRFCGYGLYREVIYKLGTVGIARDAVVEGRGAPVEADLKAWLREEAPEEIQSLRKQREAEAMARAKRARDAHRPDPAVACL